MLHGYKIWFVYIPVMLFNNNYDAYMCRRVIILYMYIELNGITIYAMKKIIISVVL